MHDAPIPYLLAWHSVVAVFMMRLCASLDFFSKSRVCTNKHR